MKNAKLSALLNTPLGVVVILGAVVLVVESLLMIFHVPIMAQFGLPHAFWDFADPILLTIIVAPLLYFLVFRRMQGDVERHRQINAAALNAIVIVNGQGRITDWNLAAEKMFHYSKEEVVGQTMHQLIAPPRYRDDAERGFARFQEAGSGPLIGKVTEISALRRDGSEFPAEVSISAVRLKGHWHAIGVIRDLTERKRAEELVSAQHAEIERARLDWKAVFDSISHPIFLHDGEFRVIRANRAYAEQAGKPFNEIIGQPYYTLFPKSDTPLPCCLRAMEKAEEEEEEEEEVAVGEAIYRSRTFCVRSEQGAYLYSVHILEDITARKRAEDMLRESEERFSHLFENMSSGVAVYQPDAACETFTFKSVNKAVERIDQIRREDVVGRDVEEAFPGVRAFGLLEVFKRVCRSGEPERLPAAFYQDERISGWRDNYVYRLKSGEIVAVYDDVTERKQNEKALIHTNWALMTLSANNEALLHATSEEELLQSATRAIVERGGYCMARVSYADDNPEKSLRRVAWAGAGEDFLAEQPLTWADTEKGQVPIARAIRSGMPQVCRDIASDPGFAPWKDAALAQGYVSNIGLPLSDGSRIFGGLSIYSSEKNAFGDEDAKLLTELANNLAYGIVTLRARIERKLAEQKRLEAGIHLKDVLEDAIGAIAATLEQRDPYTAGHQRRVAQLAAAIAEEMGLSREVLEGIHFGGLIHDLGKISVPAEILGKPGRLTDIEFGLIQVHAEAGYQIVKDIAFPWPVADMVRQHHERLDGSGYPQGLKGDEIVLEARILAVADVVEAMSANRPYRPGFGMDAALDEITRVRGTQLDAVAVDACLRIIREKEFVFTK